MMSAFETTYRKLVILDPLGPKQSFLYTKHLHKKMYLYSRIVQVDVQCVSLVQQNRDVYFPLPQKPRKRASQSHSGALRRQAGQSLLNDNVMIQGGRENKKRVLKVINPKQFNSLTLQDTIVQIPVNRRNQFNQTDGCLSSR